MNRTTHTRFMALACGLAIGWAWQAQAQVLTGSGNHLPLPTAPVPYTIGPTIVVGAGTFTGQWTTALTSAWIGVFSATGPVPSSPNTGTTTYSFTALPTGGLPASTDLILADVDFGSAQQETLTLRAWGVTGVQITTPWLDVPTFVVGAGSGAGGAIVAADLPSWSFNATTGVYTFNGNTVPGNPTISVYLPTNCRITRLEVIKPNTNYVFAITAPALCYANCDGSTTPPVINAADFACFLARYRDGCP